MNIYTVQVDEGIVVQVFIAEFDVEDFVVGVLNLKRECVIMPFIIALLQRIALTDYFIDQKSGTKSD